MDVIIIDHWQSRSPTCTWYQLRTYDCNITIEPTGVKRISMELLWALSATKYIFQRFVGFQVGVGAPEEEPPSYSMAISPLPHHPTGNVV